MVGTLPDLSLMNPQCLGKREKTMHSKMLTAIVSSVVIPTIAFSLLFFSKHVLNV